MAYNDVVEGDPISAEWMNLQEDSAGGKAIFGTNQYPAQAATYIVFKSGSYYCARNGTTGKIDFDDTTFSTLMNETILDMYDSTEGQGGLIHIKPATYPVTSQINMRPAINIRSESMIGRLGAGLSGAWKLGTVLDCVDVDTTIFSFDYPTPTTTHYVTDIQGFYLVGPEYGAVTASTKPLIDIQCNSNYASDIKIDWVGCFYALNGIRILNDAAATYKIWNINILNSFIEENEDAGVLIDSTSNQIIERVKILNTHFFDNCGTSGNGGIEIDGHSTYGGIVANCTFEKEYSNSIYMADEADHWGLLNNIIYDGGVGGANTLDGISLNDVDYISVTGGSIGNLTTANLKYAIESDNNCTYCGFTGVTVDSQTDPAIIQGTGAGMKTSNCPGYLNYNSGVTAAQASGTDIPHGLISGATGLTPTCVMAQCGTTGATGPWSDTLGATNFKHNWAGGGNETVYWIAIYDP